MTFCVTLFYVCRVADTKAAAAERVKEREKKR